MRRALPLLLLAVTSLVSSATAHAQDDPRALFERGTQAVQERRFGDAVPDLERSLSIAPRPATAFNLIVALDGLGRLVRAGEVCRELVAGDLGELSPVQLTEARGTCDALRARLAHLVLRAGGAAPLEIRVDGRIVGQVGAGARLETELDPGWHHVSATAPGRPPVERSVSLESGERTELDLALAAAAAAVPEAPTSPPAEPDLPLILGLVLGGVVLAGGAITLGVVLSSGAPEPVPGDFRVVMTLAEL